MNTPNSPRFPAEFETHSATWLLWPFRSDNWRMAGAPAQAALTKLVNTISEFEPVYLGALPHLCESVGHSVSKQVTIVPMEYDDAWIRDTGPTIVSLNKQNLRGICWDFNSYDGLLTEFAKDSGVSKIVCDTLSLERSQPNITLEGGSILSNGCGILLTTERCLLEGQRNLGFTKASYEAVFAEHLGIEHVIWLPRGIAGDETGEHVDNMAVFFDEKTIGLCKPENSSDSAQQQAYLTAKQAISAKSTQHNLELEIIDLPIPSPQFTKDDDMIGLSRAKGKMIRKIGQRLTTSYANLVFVNGGLVLPTFDVPEDAKMLALLADMYPQRKIVQLAGRELCLGGGGFHCLTQQVPFTSGKQPIDATGIRTNR
jgi:agmatine deiminase